MTSLSGSDKELTLMSMTASEIVESLTLEDVKNFLESLGVTQLIVNEEKGYIVCPTICHNPIDEAESMKLYWYHNNKLFRCYTECNEAMSIFELYRRFMSINEYPITLYEAEDYIRQFLRHININYEQRRKQEINFEQYDFSNTIPILDEYPISVLDCFVKYYHPTWLKDGITKDVMDNFQIRFSLGQNKIIIPHFDINNRLVGIRGRALEPEELATGRKYAPVQLGDVMYSYQTGFNLYGLNRHKNAIKKYRIAIIAEGEKSAMLDEVYNGEDSICVACCGSKFNKYQISLLTDFLDVNEIVIALDKEYTDWKSIKARKYRQKIETSCATFKYKVKMSYIWDYDNLLSEKDSPYDKGQEIFEELFKNRVKIR